MQQVETLEKLLRTLCEARKMPEIASLAIQGLPRDYHRVAGTFNTSALLALLQREQGTCTFQNSVGTEVTAKQPMRQELCLE